MTEQGQAVRQILAGLVAVELDPSALINVAPSTYIDPAQANAIYFGSPSGPLTPATLDAPQLLALQIRGAKSGGASNIGSIGGNMADPTTHWKFTAIIRAGDRSKSTSVVYSGGGTLEAALVKAKDWARFLAQLLGNSGTAGAPSQGETPQSPQISYIRITDAKQPRIGQLFDVRSGNFFGLASPTSGGGSADYLGTALAIRLPCTTLVAPTKTVFSNHGFVGVPDGVVTGGDAFFDQFPWGTSVYATYLNFYLTYITAGVNSLGCMTTDDVAQPKKHTGIWDDTLGVWRAKLPAHGFTNGDRIRVSAANARFFNGSYIVTGVTAATPDEFLIAKGPVTGIPGPTTAVVQRIQLASGLKPVIFAAFNAPVGGWVTPFGIKVSGRRPGRRFNPVSFRSKQRRPHS